MLKSERLIGMVLGEAGVPFAHLIAKMLISASEYDAERMGAVLYIKNAPATLNGTTLEVM